jgi:hypothetical protein
LEEFLEDSGVSALFILTCQVLTHTQNGKPVSVMEIFNQIHGGTFFFVLDSRL